MQANHWLVTEAKSSRRAALSNEVITALIGASVRDNRRRPSRTQLPGAEEVQEGRLPLPGIPVLRRRDAAAGTSASPSSRVSQEAPHLQGLFIPLLVNQAIYLLIGSEQSEARNEQDNLRRIMALAITPAAAAAGFAGHYRELLRGAQDKKAGRARAGVNVDTKTLDEWTGRLTAWVG